MVRMTLDDDPRLSFWIRRIDSALRGAKLDGTAGRSAATSAKKALNLEPWEIAAWQKLLGQKAGRARVDERLLDLYLRGAALRLRMADETHELKTSYPVSDEVLGRVDESLTIGRELDSMFGAYLSEGQIKPTSPEIERLYRSRLRLLRPYAGLWLLRDDHARGQQPDP